MVFLQLVLMAAWFLAGVWVYRDYTDRHSNGTVALLLALGTFAFGLLVLIPYLIFGRRR